MTKKIAWLAVALMLLTACKTRERVVEVVTAPQVHTEYIVRTDTVMQTDTIVDRQETIVRMADSALMAEYGIRLAEGERAWLIEKSRLQREISRLEQHSADTLCTTDTVTVVYEVPVVEEVPAEMTGWQRFRLCLANIVIYAIVIGVGMWIYFFVRPNN